MNKEKVLKWIHAAGVRAVKTFFQTAVGYLTVGQIFSEVSWGIMFSAAAVASVYSLFTSLAGLPELKGEQ